MTMQEAGTKSAASGKAGILHDLTKRMASFSPNQRKLALYLIDHFDTTPFMTSLELAAACGISQPSVSRFVQVLGFTNFDEFRRAVGSAVMQKLGLTTPVDRFAHSLRAATLDELIGAQQLEITALSQILHGPAYQRCVNYLSAARRVVIIGLASASPLAVHTHLYLYRIRDQVHAVTDYAMTGLITIEHLDSADCALVFAIPRYTRDTLKLLEQLRARSVPVILVTAQNNVELTPYADEVLPVPVTIGPVTAIPSAMLGVASLLVEGVALKDKARTLEKLDRFEENASLSDFFLVTLRS